MSQHRIAGGDLRLKLLRHFPRTSFSRPKLLKAEMRIQVSARSLRLSFDDEFSEVCLYDSQPCDCHKPL